MKVHLCLRDLPLNRIFMFTYFTRIKCFFLSSMKVLYGRTLFSFLRKKDLSENYNLGVETRKNILTSTRRCQKESILKKNISVYLPLSCLDDDISLRRLRYLLT